MPSSGSEIKPAVDRLLLLVLLVILTVALLPSAAKLIVPTVISELKFKSVLAKVVVSIASLKVMVAVVVSELLLPEAAYNLAAP